MTIRNDEGRELRWAPDGWGGWSHWPECPDTKAGRSQFAIRYVAHCDSPGCTAMMLLGSMEHNGEKVEAIYETQGWHLYETTLCPEHAEGEQDEHCFG